MPREFEEKYVQGPVTGDFTYPIYPHPIIIKEGQTVPIPWGGNGCVESNAFPRPTLDTTHYVDLSTTIDHPKATKIASFYTEDDASAVNIYVYRQVFGFNIYYTFQDATADDVNAGTMLKDASLYSGDYYVGCLQEGNIFWLSYVDTRTTNYTDAPELYGVDLEQVAEIFGTSFKYELSSDAYGEASDIGGYGAGDITPTFDDSSDTIGIPTMPSIGVSSVGFVNVYNVSTGGLQSFGSELFPNLNFTPISSLPAPQDVTDALVNVATVLVDFGNQIPAMIDMYINNTLINYIIDCHIIPVAPTVGGSEYIKVGFRTFTPTADKVTSDYIDFDCGTINIGEYYANFADYEPYTRAKLFLPFVGYVDIKPEYWQSGLLQVVYRFNVIDGSFMAFVKSSSSKSKLSDTVIGQYGGNCCVHIPITGANYSNLVSGVVGAAAAVASAQPGTGGSAALDAAINLANSKANVQQSNGYNATTSFLGVRVPYLVIERTVSNMSSAYPDEIGIPCNINLDFSELSGLVQSQDVILDGITGATDAELKEIARLLAGGVYF